MAEPGKLPHQLREWWENGEGAAKIRWGTPGDFGRCVRLYQEKTGATPENAKGFCAERHHGATGHWPGEKKGHEVQTETFHPGHPDQSVHGNRYGRGSAPRITVDDVQVGHNVTARHQVWGEIGGEVTRTSKNQVVISVQRGPDAVKGKNVAVPRKNLTKVGKTTLAPATAAAKGETMTETLAGKAIQPDADGSCPEGYHKMPNGVCLPELGAEADVDEFGDGDVLEFADVDNSPWDAARAMGNGEGAKFWGAICAGHTSGDTSLKGTWKLPHHYSAGGPPNASGVAKALGRLNQTQGLTDVGAARSHLEAHRGSIRSAAKAAGLDADAFMAELELDEFAVEQIDVTKIDLGTGAWEGVLTVEGRPTGDGRQFAPGALRWQDLPLTLTYQPPSHGGMSTDGFVVGNITEIWRDGDLIRGKGMFDLDDPEAANIARQVGAKFLRGISVDVDDVNRADVELVFPEAPEAQDRGEGEAGLATLFGPPPDLVIFHDARIRSAAVVPIPAFIEATIHLASVASDGPSGGGAQPAYTSTVGAVGLHPTSTSDDAWDVLEYEDRLPNMLPIGVARRMYAYIGSVDDGRTTKLDCLLPHHEVARDGYVGAANLTACTSHVGLLNRQPDAVPEASRRAIYEHLAAHIRAGGREPLPLVDHALVAHGMIVAGGWRPPPEWFDDPMLSVPTGVTISDDGRVYGHAAQWGTCHVGYPGECVEPPREDGHPFFMTGEVVCADGGRRAVGQITVGTTHAPLFSSSSDASEHYENTGCAVADVACGNDEHGIWVAGALRPGADASQVLALRASGQVSGDWRRIGSQLRLVGLLAVNVPGFPVPRAAARVASGKKMALVAAGRISVAPGLRYDVAEQQALRRVVDIIALRIGRPVAVGRDAVRSVTPSLDELVARVHPEEVTVDA